MQSNCITAEIDEEQADVTVLSDVAKTAHDSVSAILRKQENALVENADESGRPGAKGAVRLAVRIRGRDEHHVHAADEVLHPDIEVVEHLMGVEPPCAEGCTEPLLQAMLANRSRHGVPLAW